MRTVALRWTGSPLEETVNVTLVASAAGLTPRTVPTSIPAILTGSPERTLTLLEKIAVAVKGCWKGRLRSNA